MVWNGYQENPNIQRQSKLLYLTKHDIQQNKWRNGEGTNEKIWKFQDKREWKQPKQDLEESMVCM